MPEPLRAGSPAAPGLEGCRSSYLTPFAAVLVRLRVCTLVGIVIILFRGDPNLANKLLPLVVIHQRDVLENSHRVQLLTCLVQALTSDLQTGCRNRALGSPGTAHPPTAVPSGPARVQVTEHQGRSCWEQPPSWATSPPTTPSFTLDRHFFPPRPPPRSHDPESSLLSPPHPQAPVSHSSKAGREANAPRPDPRPSFFSREVPSVEGF